MTAAPTVQAEAPEIEANYSAGKVALKGGKLDDALKHFKVALKFSKGDEGRTWQMLLAIALTYKERSEPHHAIEYYRRFLKQTEADQDMMQVKWKKRREMASRDLAEVERLSESTHGFVPVKSTPPGARLFVDGKPGGADGDAVSPFGLILPAGTHAIRVALEGYQPHEQTVSVRAGGAHPVKVTLKPLTLAPAPSPPRTPEPLEPRAPISSAAPASEAPLADATLSVSMSEGETPSALGAWITIGSGAALGIAGVALTVMASMEQQELEEIDRNQTTMEDISSPAELKRFTSFSEQWDETQARRDTYQLVGGILYGVSAAVVIGGVVWLLVAEPDEDTTAGTFGIVPTAGGAHGHAAWRF